MNYIFALLSFLCILVIVIGGLLWIELKYIGELLSDYFRKQMHFDLVKPNAKTSNL